MQVERVDGTMAVCTAGAPANGSASRSSTSRRRGAGSSPGRARRSAMTPQEAAESTAALDALAAVMAGEGNVDAYFADLVTACRSCRRI